MAGLRDVLIHDYFGVDIEIVWDVTKNQIPIIYKPIKDIISREMGSSGKQEKLEY